MSVKDALLLINATLDEGLGGEATENACEGNAHEPLTNQVPPK